MGTHHMDAKIVNRRDLDFLLYELLDVEALTRRPRYAEHDRETFDSAIDLALRVAAEKFAPHNRKADANEPQFDGQRVTMIPEVKEAVDAYCEAGLMTAAHDYELGGMQLPFTLSQAALALIKGANVSTSAYVMLTASAANLLLAHGTEEQIEKFAKPMLAGRFFGTMVLTEPHAGSSLGDLRTTAEPAEDGTYRIRGNKIFISAGDHELSENIVHLVLARIKGAPPGVKGISLFIVPKFLVNEDGSLGARNDVWCASIEHKLGIHGSPTTVLFYGSGKGDVGEGAVGYLVGEENRGLEYMFIMMNAARYAVGVQGVAVSERALQQAVAYAAERVQGQALEGSAGPVTIDRHPDVQRMLLTMRAITEGIRATALCAAGVADRAHAAADEHERARSKALYDYLVPIVKGFSTEASIEVTSLGVQVHGGMGFIEETGAAQYYRDARILPIYEGTTAIQANDFVGRKILRDGGTVALGVVEQMRATVKGLEDAAAAGGDDAAALTLIATRLQSAAAAYEAALRHVLENARQDIRGVYMGSVPLLMLAGTVHAGWQLARAAQACHRHQQAGTATPFHQRKLATAVFYAAHVLCRAQGLSDAVQAGGLAADYANRAI